jgi:uncharacterized protein (DUF2336 family)
MSAQKTIVEEFQEAIGRDSRDGCAAKLGKITDLFFANIHNANDEQVGIFDHLMLQLVERIETRARAELGNRLAPVQHPPLRVIGRLARDDEVIVAAPVLRRSEQLNTGDLVEIAEQKSQGHLLAISGRKQIQEEVTDVLLRRGDVDVVRNVSGNEGARFSQNGLDLLAEHAGADGLVAKRLVSRSDIPLQTFCAMLSRATEEVRQRLLAEAPPQLRADIEQVVTTIAGEIAEEGVPSHDFAAALRRVLIECPGGVIAEADVLRYAQARKFEETVAALSIVCTVPTEVFTRLIEERELEPLLILCRAVGFEWPTVRAVLQVDEASRRNVADKLTVLCEQYTRMKPASAKQILAYWRSRAEMSHAAPGL